MTTNVNLGFVADAAGTVDAITATYSPAYTALVDKMLVWFRATGANTSTTPTFSPNGLTAKTIVKQGGQPLVAGDIPGDRAVIGLCYDLDNDKWEILYTVNENFEPYVGSYTTAQIAGLTGMTLRQRVFNTTDNDYEWYDGTRWVKEAHPKYKLYLALLGQTGTGAPVATVLENTIGSIVWTRDNPGHYSGTLAGAFTNLKTTVLINKSARDQQDSDLLITIAARTESVDTVNVYTDSTDVAGGTVTDSDDILDGTTIEIRVYY